MIKTAALRGLLILLCFASSLCAAQISVIQTQRNAAQLLPLIQSQLNQGSSAQAYQNQIILNASADETAKIKALLQQIDKTGRQLLITVKKQGDTAQSQQQNNTQVTISQSGNSRTETRVTTHIRGASASSQGYGEQSVRATEGLASFISIGKSRLYQDGDQGQAWQPANTGFYITPFIHGDNVNLQIKQFDNQHRSQQHMAQQQLNSTVTGLLNQWILIGAINSESQQRQQKNTQTQQSNSQIYVKVELLP